MNNVPEGRSVAGIRKDHLVQPTPPLEEPAKLLEAFERALGHRATPLACYQIADGVAYWDPEGPEITLLRPPFGSEYLSSIEPSDVDGADELEQLLEQRFGGGER